VIFSIPPRATKQDVQIFEGLLEAGKYRAVIDGTYPMSRAPAASLAVACVSARSHPIAFAAASHALANKFLDRLSRISPGTACRRRE
jgi:hypothetical protein